MSVEEVELDPPQLESQLGFTCACEGNAAAIFMTTAMRQIQKALPRFVCFRKVLRRLDSKTDSAIYFLLLDPFKHGRALPFDPFGNRRCLHSTDVEGPGCSGTPRNGVNGSEITIRPPRGGLMVYRGAAVFTH
jgi:hypothetical protein